MRWGIGKLILGLVIIRITGTPSSLSQTPAKKLSFEVGSVRPNTSGGATYLLWPLGRFSATNVTVRSLMEFGYRARDGSALLMEQIVGGPSWIDTDRFDIQAKAEGAARKEDIQFMVQSLLEDRFQLKAHHETRELPVYNLVVLKDGPKFKLLEDQHPSSPAGPSPLPAPGTFGMMGSASGTTLTGSAVPISAFVNMLHGPAGRPVIDKTDLKGLFDITLQFSPSVLMSSFGPIGAAPAGPVTEAPVSDPTGPSLFSAIQEQLGLKLESARGRVEVLVIDGIQKPSEN